MDVVVSRLKEISQAVLYATEGATLENVLERIAQVAKELIGTRYAALGIPNGLGGLRYFKTSGMSVEEIVMIEHPPVGHGLLGVIMKERRSIRLQHIQDDSRSVGFPKNHPPMQAFLGVPVQMGQQLFGMFYLCDKQDGTMFNDGDELLLETMASYVALAIVNAQTNQKQSRIALLEERERIGMELHDGVIQSLYGIGMQAQLLTYNDSISPKDIAPIVNALDDVIEDIRGFILQLRQRSDNNLTIRVCFQQMLERLHLPPTLEVVIDAPNTKPPFTPAVFESVCLIVSEALSNAARHASARQIRLSTRQEGRLMYIIVEDDGRGFDPMSSMSSSETSGLGLTNMQYRARLYGGDVIIESTPQKGTRVSIWIPIRAH